MVKVIKKAKRNAIILFVFEILIIGLLVFLYFFELPFWPTQRELFNLEYLVLIFTFFIVLDLVFIWATVTHIQRVRSRNIFSASEIVSSDVKEAYHFAMLGLVVVDKNFNVIWASELFTERQINILDKNILEWQKGLKNLVKVDENSDDAADEEIVKLEIHARNYAVKYLSDANLFIFKDITEVEYLYRENKDQSVFVGIIMIDNYTDLTINREADNPVTALIHSAIYEYCKKYDVLVRRYRDDAFLLIGNYVAYSKMEHDRFSLLDQVRDLEENQENPFTLSMAFAYKFPDIVKLNDMAVKAIDLAMARGGDQVVVAEYGAEHRYFGGAAVAIEKRNKVRVRVTADTLSALIKNSGNVIIMPHAVADLDAIGAALGMKAVADYVKRNDPDSDGEFIPAKILYDTNSTESKTRGAVSSSFSKEEAEAIFISPRDLGNGRGIVKPNTLLVVVDVSRPENVLYPPALDMFNSIAVIDHHRRAESFIASPVFQYIEPSASSTSELITELIQYGNFPEFELDENYATIMLAGIYLDTNYFRNNTTGMRTFEACMVLKDFGADNGKADDFLKDEYEEYALKTKIMSTLKTPFFGVVIAKSDLKNLVDPATLAKVANQCIQIKGVSAAFVLGVTGEKEVRISARSDGTINVQILLEKLGGGGHQAAAGAAFHNEALDRVEARLMQVLQLYLNEARVSEKK
ncbi:MAG: DHH family phosphoesterase [Bacilli bacterium]